MWVLVYFVILLIVVLILERLVNKLLGVEKKKISETSGKNIDRWGKGIILVIFLCTLPFYITSDKDVMKWFWIIYFVISMGFQSILEWKYLNSKQYVSTLIFLLLTIMVFYNIEYFAQLLDWR